MSTEGLHVTDFCERCVVHRPQSDAGHFLATFVAEHRFADDTRQNAPRLPATLFATWRSLIARRGVACFYALGSSSDRQSTYSVTWSPKGSGPFPVFAGALATVDLARDDCFGLILSGHYEPPFGKVGAAFDAIFGRRIVRTSAQAVLRSIAAQVENTCARDKTNGDKMSTPAVGTRLVDSSFEAHTVLR
jgi:hypothetical protein